ncbi:HAMP domain protein [Collimonas arenae]|uniref:histidine kinase n=1 Tax=Collimonas arenae TaxID=279058 RepID=A0A127QMV8_9BURK|nr:ATP-binding protein [Collimonas arenae]AMP01462.1 HAMP domain protein [Collimonas arenae]AMP11363.1 HAMP domain protein [Collimonas arenae]
MLRILIRLYLIVATLSIVAIVFVQKGFPYLFESEFKAQMLSEYSNEVTLLRDSLAPLNSAEQQTALARMNQLSPRRYTRLSPEQIQELSPSERRELARYHMVWTGRGDHNRISIYAALEDGGVIEIRSYNLDKTEAIAYVVIFTVMLAAMLVWLMPHWRDLEKLRVTAARFGDGALDARAKLSENSSIKQLCAYFNNMADRIGSLIKAQRDMVNAASHELRTPLARLEFGLVNLMDTTEDNGTHKRIQAMRKDVEELDILVGELLTLSMLEQSSLPEPSATIPLEDFLRGATGVSQEELQLRHNTVIWSISPVLREVVTEPRSLARAFSNLMRNALRYSRSTIRVRTEIDRAGGSWNLIVEDDGVGIPEQERERVFDPFYRLDRSRDRATGGYGLGLAIVKKIAERLGGSARVGSSDLGGAMFVLRFPLPDR